MNITNPKLIKNMNGQKSIAIFFPKDSEAIFNKTSKRTFGGTAIHLYHFARELFPLGKIFSIIPEYSAIDFPDKDKFNLGMLYKESDSPIIKFLKFRKFLKKNNLGAVIQLGLTLESCILSLYLFVIGIKFVFIFVHDVESLGFYQNSRKRCFFFWFLVKFASILIAQNDIEKENLISKYPDIEKKVKVLKKGIDFSKIKQSGEKEYDCISIARCEEWKNIEAYLEIAKRNQNCKFLLIAPPVHGKEHYYSHIKNLVSQIKNVTFYSFVPYEDIYTIISLSKIMIVTSDMEGDWPLTVLEATASGVPVISLNYSYGNLIDGYGAGFYCNGSMEKMNEYFNKLINNKNLLDEMSKNAYRYSYENHNIKTNALKLAKWLGLQ